MGKKYMLNLCLSFWILLFIPSFAQDVNVLVLLPDHYGLNTYLNLCQFERYGWQVTIAAVMTDINPCSNHSRLPIDKLVSDIQDVTIYDCVVIMPANRFVDEPYGDLRKSPETIALLKKAAKEGLVLYATCAGVRVLATARVINGVHITGRADFKEEYEAAGAIYHSHGVPPVIDMNVVTSTRGMYYNVQNCQAIATALEIRGGRTQGKALGKSISLKTTAIEKTGKIQWSKTYGDVHSEGGRGICQAFDGGYIITGYTFSEGAGNADVLLMKTDQDGNLLWKRTFGGSGWEYGHSIALAPDGGYIITGYTTSFGSGLKDVYLIRTDTQGYEIWSKTFGGSQLDVGNSVCVADDGGFVVCGHTESFGSGEDDVYIIKTDMSGDTLWTRTFGGRGPEMGRSVAKTADSGFILGGSTGTYGMSNQDFFMIKTDARGEYSWKQTFGQEFGHGYDWGNFVSPTENGGFIFVGDSDRRLPQQVYLIKTDSSGNVIWRNNFGSSFYDFGLSVCELNDGSLFVSGSIMPSGSTRNDVYLIHCDSEGDPIWIQSLGESGAESGHHIIQTREGDLVMTGHTDSYGAEGYDVLLCKMKGPPQFYAEPTSGRPPLEVRFIDQSSMKNKVAWQWDFDNDGSFDSDEQNPYWTYIDEGVYTVRLKVTNDITSTTSILEDFITVCGVENGLQFNGADSYGICPASSSLNCTDALTVEAWIYPTDWGENTSNGYGRILDKEAFRLFIKKESLVLNDECLCFQVRNASGAIYTFATPDGSIVLNRWQHIAVTYDADRGDIKIYVDGIEQDCHASGIPAGSIRENLNADLYIGNDPGQSYTFQGIIDEIRLWDVVRTDADLNAYKDCSLPGSDTGLVGYWPLDEGEGDQFYDKSGQGNDGSLSGTNWVNGVHLGPTMARQTGPLMKVPFNAILHPIYPNPFNPATTIPLELSRQVRISLAIFDMKGRLVKSLIHDEVRKTGQHHIRWNGTNESGEKVSSGVYICKLFAESFHDSQKLIMVH